MIRSIQLKRQIEKIVLERLRAGKFPALETITARLAWVFRGRAPGSPLLRLRPAGYRQTSSAGDYNASFAELGEDLETAFAAALEEDDQFVRQSVYLDTQFRYLEQRLKSLVERAQYEEMGDSFADLTRVDLVQTTALVDLENGVVTLPQSEGSVRIPPDKITCQVGLETPYLKASELSSFARALDDDLHTAWLYEVRAEEKLSVSVSAILDLGEEMTVNRLTVDANADNVELWCLQDGKWRLIQASTLSGRRCFDFGPLTARYLKLVLVKHAPDSFDGEYAYRFSCRDVRLYRMGYVGTGSLVSTFYPFPPGVVGRLTLNAEVERPPLTDIKYYVNFNKTEPFWQPLADNRLDLSQLVQKEMLFTGYELHQNVGGLNFYRLRPDVPAGTVFEPSLTRGLSKYLKKRAYIEKEPGYKPDLADWLAIPPYEITSSYKSPQNIFDTSTHYNASREDASGQLVVDNFFYYQFYYEAAHPETVFVQMQAAGGFSYTVYLNGSLAPVADDRVSLFFNEGLNEVVVLAFGDGNANSHALSMGWEPPNMRAHSLPMEYVDPVTLYYGTAPGNRNRFALVEGTDSMIVLINYNPGDEQSDASEFLLRYYVPARQMDGVQLKAVLSRQGELAPKLKRYNFQIN